MSKHGFQQVSDEDVLNVWYAPQDNDEQAEVHPSYYEEAGTPVSSDDEDMVYSHTIVRLPENPRLTLIKDMAKTSDMFYVPETREEANQWLEGQVPLMPTGVSFMVGYNYAMSQIIRALETQDVDGLRKSLTRDTAEPADTDNPWSNGNG